jgi:hypothetical protein
MNHALRPCGAGGNIPFDRLAIVRPSVASTTADYRPPPHTADKPQLPSRGRDQQIGPCRDYSGGLIMIERPHPTDYSVAVKRNRKPPNSWRWEINCPGKSVPVERSTDNFQTMAEATRAGKEALQRLVKLRLTLTLPIDGVA